MRCTILLMLAVAPGISFAQKPGASQKAVFALEDSWTVGVVKKDTVLFRRITAPGFIYTEDNAVMTRAELIKAIATSTEVVTRSWNEGMKFYDYTPTAVVTGILHMQGTSDKKPFRRRYRFTDTWLYRDGRWQLIAAQDYLIPK